MSPRLLLADPESAADALTFAGRAARVTVEGVRLQASGGILAMTAAPLAPRGFGDPTREGEGVGGGLGIGEQQAR